MSIAAETTAEFVPPKRKLLIRLAWCVEIVGVLLGFLVAAYLTFGDQFPTNPWGWLLMAPFAAIGCTELFRIPLMEKVRWGAGVATRLAAAVGVLLLSYVALENYGLGVERIVTFRMAAVDKAYSAVLSAGNELQNAEKSRDDYDASRRQRAQERATQVSTLQKTVKAKKEELVQLNQDEAKSAADLVAHQKATWAACQWIKDECYRPKTKAFEDKHIAERELNTKRRADISSSIDSAERSLHELALPEALPSELNGDTRVALARTRVEEVRKAFETEKRDSFIYRIAAMVFGRDELTPAEILRVRGYFSIAVAGTLSLGSLLASFSYFGHGKQSLWSKYRAWRVMQRLTPEQRAKARGQFYARLASLVGVPLHLLIRSLRAWVARRRKDVVRTVEKEVEVRVDRVVEKTIEVKVPVEVERIIERKVEVPVDVLKVVKMEVPVEIDRVVVKTVPEQIIEKPVLIERRHTVFVPYTGEGPLPSPETSIMHSVGKPAEEALAAVRKRQGDQLRAIGTGD